MVVGNVEVLEGIVGSAKPHPTFDGVQLTLGQLTLADSV